VRGGSRYGTIFAADVHRSVRGVVQSLDPAE